MTDNDMAGNAYSFVEISSLRTQVFNSTIALFSKSKSSPVATIHRSVFDTISSAT